ncbi:MAG TPA: phosphate transport system regulatory protein PhoU [Bifidobacterium sp.]|nr:phosphate transport system regulatory protein PhoU [Verrucomicrobiota bacterium]HCH21686.1 phosphate transport system regulatory protein PhoU [Bifidobacterium sp.]
MTMKVHFEKALARLQGQISENAARAQNAVISAVQAMETENVALADSVVEGDTAIDLAENAIEEQCLDILALYQPVATDLRRVITILKANGEIERAGDLAVNIANRVEDAKRYKKAVAWDFDKMGSYATTMFVDSLVALAKSDVPLARAILARDDELDALHKKSYERATEGILSTPAAAGYYLDALTVSRCLERLGDIATNIAEDVIYLETAEIVRHEPPRS